VLVAPHKGFDRVLQQPPFFSDKSGKSDRFGPSGWRTWRGTLLGIVPQIQAFTKRIPAARFVNSTYVAEATWLSSFEVIPIVPAKAGLSDGSRGTPLLFKER
jgi:hypothetical protein